LLYACLPVARRKGRGDLHHPISKENRKDDKPPRAKRFSAYEPGTPYSPSIKEMEVQGADMKTSLRSESNDTSKVIIRRHVFDYADKAPFVASGESILGALEYDEPTDSIKCHECGVFVSQSLGEHLRWRHKMPAADYREAHGLATTSSLSTPSKRKANARKVTPAFRQASRKARALALDAGFTKGPRRHRLSERRNESGRCQAQTLFRLQLLAADLGRTPTQLECEGAGLLPSRIKEYFGGVGEAMEMAGLTPCRPGRPRTHPSTMLPAGFPTKEELLEARMPWPPEYAKVGYADALRKRSA
jgi:hypothetical protein